MSETEERISAALFEFFGSDDAAASILDRTLMTLGERSELADRIAVWIADGGAMRAAANIRR